MTSPAAGPSHLKSTDDIEITDRLFHTGDTDTYIDFGGNIIDVVAGGFTFIQTSTTAGGQLFLGDTTNDVDVTIRGNSKAVLTYNWGDDVFVINSTTSYQDNIAATWGDISSDLQISSDGDDGIITTTGVLNINGLTIDTSANMASVGTIGSGAITSTGDITTHGAITIGNSDVDQFIHFFDSGVTADFYWDTSHDRFILTKLLWVQGSFIATGATFTSVTCSGDIFTTGAGDDFWLGNATQASASFRAYANGNLNAEGISQFGVAANHTQFAADGDQSFAGSARFQLPNVTDAGPMTNTNGTESEAVYNTSDNKAYVCTATGTPATWAALN